MKLTLEVRARQAMTQLELRRLHAQKQIDARELECIEDEAAFYAKLRGVARHKPVQAVHISDIG